MTGSGSVVVAAGASTRHGGCGRRLPSRFRRATAPSASVATIGVPSSPARCGSHFIQSHSGSAAWSASSPTATSAGPWRVTEIEDDGRGEPSGDPGRTDDAQTAAIAQPDHDRHVDHADPFGERGLQLRYAVQPLAAPPELGTPGESAGAQRGPE